MSALDPAAFREALSRFPSGVTVVTTLDAEGRPWGFTASAFCAVSLDPPLVLVCVDRLADCHPAFHAAATFAISILKAGHEQLALTFATKGAAKFAAGTFRRGSLGLPLVDDAVAALECRTHERVAAGDHTILVGEVVHAHLGEGDTLVYHARRFSYLTGVADAGP